MDLDLTYDLEAFIKNRINLIDKMPEGEDKERAIKNLVELSKANTELLKTAYSNSLEMCRLDSSETLERERLEQSKALEELRFKHETAIEELRLEQKRLERTGKVEKVINYTLRIVEIGVPVGLFVMAAKIDNNDGYISQIEKAVLTKLPLIGRK